MLYEAQACLANRKPFLKSARTRVAERAGRAKPTRRSRLEDVRCTIPFGKSGVESLARRRRGLVRFMAFVPSIVLEGVFRIVANLALLLNCTLVQRLILIPASGALKPPER